MENNEDKRQDTVMQELIGEIQRLKFSEKDCKKSDFAAGFNDGMDATIEQIYSMLPKEMESYIDFANAYKTAVHYDPMIKSPRTVFNETFKPYK